MKKEISCSRELVIETLNAVVDHVIEGPDDACQLCVYYNMQNQLACADDEIPCVNMRKHGRVACRNGIIEFFQLKLLEQNENEET